MVSPFVPYHEPDFVAVITLSAFIYLANVARWVADKLLFAGLLGEILVGVIFGSPLAGILHGSWEQTFLDLGYVGLLLIVFEGGLTTPLRKLVKALPLATAIALSGIGIPIALSFLLMPIGGYSKLEAFASGAALSSTSLGTTFVVLKAVSGSEGPVGALEETLLGTVLAGAAVFDDVVGFVLSSVIATVGASVGSGNVDPWPLARPLVTSVLFAFFAPIVCKFVLGPIHRKLLVPRLASHPVYGANASLLVLILILSGSLAISYYIDSSMLLGAYVAGLIVSALDEHVKGDIAQVKHVANPSPTRPPSLSASLAPSSIRPTPSASRTPSPPPTSSPHFVPPTYHPCRSVYEEKIGPFQQYFLSPLFFASIGTAIPFISLFTGKRIWQGVVYTVLMTFAKAVCGVWIVVYAWGSQKNDGRLARKEVVLKEEKGLEMTAAPGMGEGEDEDGRGENGTRRPEQKGKAGKDGEARARPSTASGKAEEQEEASSIWAALFLGLALVARGEIGLLISQIGYVEAGLLGDDAFLVTTWAIVLCTIIGPVSVGLLIKKKGLEKVVPIRWR